MTSGFSNFNYFPENQLTIDFASLQACLGNATVSPFPLVLTVLISFGGTAFSQKYLGKRRPRVLPRLHLVNCGRGCNHRSRIRYLSKKIADFNEFSEIKKNCKNSYKNSLNARVGNEPTTTAEEFDAFHGFMLIKNIKQTYKGGLHSDLLYE